MHKTVVGLFEDSKQADRAMMELHNAGIPKENIKSVDSSGFKVQRVEGNEQSGAGMLILLKRLFGTDYHTEYEHSSPLYAEWLQKGGSLVAVNTDDRHVGEATRILETYGSTETTSRVSRAEMVEKSPVNVDQRPLRSMGPTETDRDQRKLEVIEEELHVGKRKIQRGSVRVVKHVTETPVEETINLRDETVIIERRPLDRIANDADLKELADSRVEMIETAEEPVVSKEAHVKEEITISRKIVDREEKIRDKVRKTEVNIEGMEPARVRDVEFRKDFTTRFGKLGRDYSDYAPAYEFGSDLATDGRYRNRDWADIENDVRRQWESKRPGSWRDFSEAVRHGWKTMRDRRAA
jgi:uncharacterized protein (TIGR02271 family)